MNSTSSAVRLRAVAPASSGAASRLGRSDSRLRAGGPRRCHAGLSSRKTLEEREVGARSFIFSSKRF